MKPTSLIPTATDASNRSTESPPCAQPLSAPDDIADRINRHSLFRQMKAEHVAVMIECAETFHFDKGEILFREGDFADRLFLIESGCVALEAHEPSHDSKLVAELSAGEVLGWSWLFPPFSWRFTARAIEPTSGIVLRGSHLLAAAEQDHDFGFELMKRVSQVLIHRLQTTRACLMKSKRDSLRL